MSSLRRWQTLPVLKESYPREDNDSPRAAFHSQVTEGSGYPAVPQSPKAVCDGRHNTFQQEFREAMMNPGLKREAWDRTRPNEDWSRDDPPPRKPATRDPLSSPIRSGHGHKREMLEDIRARLEYCKAEKVLIAMEAPASALVRTKVAIPIKVEESANKSELQTYWQTRPCFICSKVGACEHRESFADWAL